MDAQTKKIKMVELETFNGFGYKVLPEAKLKGMIGGKKKEFQAKRYTIRDSLFFKEEYHRISKVNECFVEVRVDG